MAGSKSRSAGLTSARERARRAKAELDAKRAEHDRKIEDAAAEFYSAVDAEAAARDALEAALAGKVAAVGELFRLGQSVEDSAALCGVEVSEVRVLRKQAAASKSTDEQPTLDQPAE